MILTDNSLQFTSIPVILSAYLTYCKGGYSVSYGRLLNSRGGSTKAQATSRHGGAALEREEAARVQSSRLVAYQSERATGMDGKAEQQREVTTLAISASSTKNVTCSCSGSKWHSLADTAFCYDNTSSKGLVGRDYFMNDWNDWYASRETVRIPAIKLPQKPLTITGFIREIVRRYAAQDHVSEQDYLDMLILKDQYERRDRALLD